MTDLDRAVERMNEAAKNLVDAQMACARIQVILLSIGSVAFGVWQGSATATLAAMCFSLAWFYGQE